MGSLNRYLLGQAVRTVGGLVAFALVVLLLERLLRIFQVVSTSSRPGSDAANMVVNLLPHYLGIAIPLAMMLGTIMVVDRLSKSSELVAGLGAGVGLSHMVRPFLFIAAILAALTILIEGWLQPLGRYNYRAVEDSIKQTSYAAALRAGSFTPVGNRTFFAGTDVRGAGIGPVFIYERLYSRGTPAGVRITTAERGALEIREPIREPVLQLSEGQTYQLRGEDMGGDTLLGGLSFEESAISGSTDVEGFRQRGRDDRELTTAELVENRDGSVNTTLTTAENNAALHHRLARAALLLILPFIAVPFGLNYGRNPSSAGIFIGVVMLVAIQKALEFAQSLGASGAIPAWSGVWGIIAVLAVFGGWLFRASAVKMGQPPLTSFQYWVKDMQDGVRKLIGRIRSQPQAQVA